MKASEVINPARRELRDENSDNYRWDDARLLEYLQVAEEEVIKLRAGANPKYTPVELVTGETHHRGRLPTDALKIIRVTRNLAAADGPPGADIIGVDRELLVRGNRWSYKEKGVPAIEVWAPDPDDLLSFHTDKPADSVWVEVLYAKRPPLVSKTGDEVEVGPEHRFPLQLFLQGFCLMEDDPGADFPRGEAFLVKAYELLGLGWKAAKAMLPKQREQDARSSTDRG